MFNMYQQKNTLAGNDHEHALDPLWREQKEGFRLLCLWSTLFPCATVSSTKIEVETMSGCHLKAVNQK